MRSACARDRRDGRNTRTPIKYKIKSFEEAFFKKIFEATSFPHENATFVLAKNKL